MSTQTVLKMVDEAVARVERAGSGAVSAQAAFVRALVDEVERHHPEDRRVTAVRAQLCEELEQLLRAMGAPSAEQDARPIDVLVVEDDEHGQRALAGVLRSLGYPYRLTRSASEALVAFDEEPSAIVLSDWNMPGMSGFELCMLLKRREPPPYVILVTAATELARVLDDTRGGVDDFLSKPIDLDEIEARLRSGAQIVRALRSVTALNEQLGAVAA